MDHLSAAILLVIAAALTATYRLLIKTAGDRIALLTGTNGLSAAFGLVLVWFVPIPSATAFGYLAASSVAYTATMMLLTRGYAHADFGVLTPLYPAMRTLVLAFIMVGFYGEVAEPHHWAAVALTASAFMTQRRAREAIRPAHLKTVGMAVAIGTASGLQHVFDIGGVRTATTPWSYLVWNLFIGLPIIVYGLASRSRQLGRSFKGQAAGIVTGSVLDMLSYGMILFVVHYIALIDVLPLINLHIVFSALIGALWLREPHPERNMSAAILLAAAVFIVEWY